MPLSKSILLLKAFRVKRLNAVFFQDLAHRGTSVGPPSPFPSAREMVPDASREEAP